MATKTYILVTTLALLFTVSGFGQTVIRKVNPGQKYSGFLRDYSDLKPRSDMDGEMLTYVNHDKVHGLRHYVCAIVDPVQIYLQSDGTPTPDQEQRANAAAEYFRQSLIRAVSDAFPVMDEPGPLCLRLRSALVGVDMGKDSGPDHQIDIGKVGVEMELIDSQTGERIAAAVDKASLGEGVALENPDFYRAQKNEAAREAFDGWAERVREFLDAEQEIPQSDAAQADKSYQPY